MYDSIIRALDFFLVWVQRYNGKPFDKRAEEELSRLDADLYALCQKGGIEIPRCPVSPNCNPFGFFGLSFYRSNLGMTVQLTPAWEQAMRGVRATVEAIRENAEQVGTNEERPSSDDPVANQGRLPLESSSTLGDLDSLLVALDSLITFVTKQPGNRSHDDFIELVRLDQEVSTHCQGTGLAFPSITFEGVNYDLVGFCRIPVTRHTGGCFIFIDRGWQIGMRGLRRTAELAQERIRNNQKKAEELGPSVPPRNPATSDRYRVGSGKGQEASLAAARLWAADQLQTFEHLRDMVCEAAYLVAEANRRALSGTPDQTMADVGQDLRDLLEKAVLEGQGIWFGTPISRYLDRAEGPVNLDNLEARVVGRVSGSSYHDLALSLAAGLLRWIGEALPMREYTSAMRFYTAAGDCVGEHLVRLIALVRCECQMGVARWKAEGIPALQASNFSTEKLDPSRCPGCMTIVPEKYRILPRVACLACGQWELYTGIKVIPVAGPPGTAPKVTRLTHPFWQPLLPEHPPKNGGMNAEGSNKQGGVGKEGEPPPEAGAQPFPPLSDRKLYILGALYKLKAFDADTRQTTEKIAQEVEGRYADPAGFKDPIAELVSAELVGTKRGRSGGCWLTPKGKERFEQRGKR
jgi:hypothetical protein